MPDTFEEALAASQIELTGLESGSDDYSLAMARDPAGYRVALRFTCPRRTEPVGQPGLRPPSGLLVHVVLAVPHRRRRPRGSAGMTLGHPRGFVMTMK